PEEAGVPLVPGPVRLVGLGVRAGFPVVAAPVAAARGAPAPPPAATAAGLVVPRVLVVVQLIVGLEPASRGRVLRAGREPGRGEAGCADRAPVAPQGGVRLVGVPGAGFLRRPPADRAAAAARACRRGQPRQRVGT